MRFYDFPDAYDLFYSDKFQHDCSKFYKELFDKKKLKDIIDCAVGTGQMLIPLAKMGYNVTGTDINPNMIKKCQMNFAHAKLFGNFTICDFRNLQVKIKQDYDCVMCTGNSLAHVKIEDIEKVIKSMDSVLRPGGVFYLDSKNWDNILQRKQRFYLFNPLIRDRGRVNYLQVWDYHKSGSVLFNHLITDEIDNKIVSKRQFYEVYYPFSIHLVLDYLKVLNYKNISVCKLGDVLETDLNKIEWYSITAEKPISV